jgi:Collagen triple helix repeat (20 copies)
MLSALRKRLHLSPATVIASLALVFAMTGGAYAASKYLITSTKQISPKVLKALKGKTGPAGAAGLAGAPGANGPAGPAGPTGPTGTGTEGKQGETGKTGETGKPGKNGESVTSKEVAAPACTNKEGGSEFTAGKTTTFACNGKEGSPWTLGGTLPKGKTLAGMWAAGGLAECAYPTCASFGYIQTGVSLALPLAFAPTRIVIAKVEGEKLAEKEWHAGSGELCEGKSGSELTTCEAKYELLAKECPGTSNEPQAAEGDLCVFVSEESNLIGTPELGVLLGPVNQHTYGFKVFAFSKEKGAMAMTGSWAATAKE